MSCAIWEDRVALFAGGDLEAAEAASVEQHIGGCAACRELAEDLRAGLDGLREAHAEPLAATHYAAVRLRVLAGLARPTRRPALWAWAWAGATVLAVAVAWVALTVRMPRSNGAGALVHASPVGRASAGLHAGAPVLERRAANGASRRRRRAMPESEATAELASLPGFGAHELVMAEAVPPPFTEEAPVHMVQLATDDPNVVIYWQLEETGESGGER